MQLVKVYAMPLDGEDPGSDMSLECTECGPVGTSPRDQAKEDSFAHLSSHGAMLQQEE